ncbi:polysaccharide lyase family 7 protein [Flavobacterium panacagri]|uniref:polysaccharide lyase family 7 protein n=1 Tax=Flavobacterium panacagri TaxID=3034146 RepID=UPI0025A5FEA1|nr:polysaccharide lyase family 7 protein [Flavobacterium panacagri]
MKRKTFKKLHSFFLKSNRISGFLFVCLILLTACTNEELQKGENEAAANEAPKTTGTTMKLVTTKLTPASVSDNGNDGNVAANTLDGNLSTRWSSDGSTGKYITYDLGSSKSISSLKIAWHQGDQRKSYFQIRVGDSTGSLTTVYDAKTTGSSGTTTALETYTLSSPVTARYVRISCFGNSLTTWNSIAETEIYSTVDDGLPDTYPTSVIGITANTWKINSFTGTPGSSAVYYDDITTASGVSYNTYNDPNYFYTDGTWTYFKCYRGLGTSSNSSNPRVELRELNNGSSASWDGSVGTHTMTWTVKVDKLPKGENGTTGVLCFGQIHGPSTNSSGVAVDDIIRVQFDGAANQSTGTVKLKISGYITEKVLGGSKSFTGYSLGTSYTFAIKYTGGKVYLYNGSTLVFSQQMDTSTEGNYFKAGNYLQSVKNVSYDGSYGLVGISSLTVSHQ